MRETERGAWTTTIADFDLPHESRIPEPNGAAMFVLVSVDGLATLGQRDNMERQTHSWRRTFG